MCRPTSPPDQDQRGLSSSVLATILFPLVLSALWLTMQWAMLTWAHATAGPFNALQPSRHPDPAQTMAQGALPRMHDERQLAQGLVPDQHHRKHQRHITAHRAARLTTVTITGTALQVIPGFPVTIQVTATSPTQRLTPS